MAVSFGRYLAVPAITSLLAFAAIAHADPAGPAAPEGAGQPSAECKVLYEGLSFWDRHAPGFLGGLKKKEAQEYFQRFSERPVSSLFPETRIVNGEYLVNVTPENNAAFRRHFEDYWQTRVQAGLISKGEVKAFRDWLKKESKEAKEAYPQLQNLRGDLYRLKEGTMGDLQDSIFLKYILATRATTPASVEEYLKSLHPSTLRTILGMVKRPFVAGAALLTSPMGFFYVANMLSSFTDKQMGAGKAMVYRITHPEEQKKNVEAAQRMEELLPDWQKVRYGEKGDRAAALKDFQDKMGRMQNDLRRFRMAVQSVNPELETNMENDLVSHLADLKVSLHSYYDHDRELRELKEKERQKPKKGGSVFTGAELRRMRQLETDLERDEQEIVPLVGQWLLVTATRDPATIPEATAAPYKNALAAYYEKMDFDKLRDATVKKLRKYLDLAESDSALVITRDPEPAQGKEKSAPAPAGTP